MTAPLLITLERPPEGRAVEIGEMVLVSTVEASNIVKDVREMITNLFGGQMLRYERLLDRTLARGLEKFRAELAAQGYDGALGVRVSHPNIVMGGAELVVYGTGFRFVES